MVDSGGQGLMEVLKGAYDAFLGKEVDYSALTSEGGGATAAGQQKVAAESAADIRFRLLYGIYYHDGKRIYRCG